MHILNIYFCAKDLGYSTEHWEKAREQDLGSTLPVSTTPSAFLSENFSGKCHSRDKGKKYPEMGRDLMMSFKKCFVCFISVHLRKGINLSCVVLCAGSQDFSCPWFTGVGRSLHVLVLHTPWIWRGLSRLVRESDAISGLKTFVLNCLHSSIGF